MNIYTDSEVSIVSMKPRFTASPKGQSQMNDILVKNENTQT